MLWHCKQIQLKKTLHIIGGSRPKKGSPAEKNVQKDFETSTNMKNNNAGRFSTCTYEIRGIFKKCTKKNLKSSWGPKTKISLVGEKLGWDV
jgi:hypothetical protein